MNNSLDKVEEILKANGIVCKRKKILFFIDSIQVKKENTNLSIVINKRDNGKLTVNVGVGILEIVVGVLATTALLVCFLMFSGASLLDAFDWIGSKPYLMVGGGIAGQGVYVARKKNVVAAMQEELDKMMMGDKL